MNWFPSLIPLDIIVWLMYECVIILTDHGSDDVPLVLRALTNGLLPGWHTNTLSPVGLITEELHIGDETECVSHCQLFIVARVLHHVPQMNTWEEGGIVVDLIHCEQETLSPRDGSHVHEPFA